MYLAKKESLNFEMTNLLIAKYAICAICLILCTELFGITKKIIIW